MRRLSSPLQAIDIEVFAGVALDRRSGAIPCRDLVPQPESQERPALADGVRPSDLSTLLGVERGGVGASTLAGHGEAVAQDQDAEGEERKAGRTGHSRGMDVVLRVCPTTPQSAVKKCSLVISASICSIVTVRLKTRPH